VNQRLVALALAVAAILACGIGQAIAPTPTVPPPAPIASPSAMPLPTRAPQSPPPAWWDPKLELPRSAEFIGDAGCVVWSTRDTNVDGIKDFMLRQASNADYQPFVITQSKSAIYDLLFVKGQNAYALNITLGSDTTVLTASRVGVMHLKVLGVANVELDLPMRTRLDITPGSEVSIGTAIPNPQCASCEYFINVHIAPFKGIGVYDSKPGISIIDVQVIPGGDPDKDDYRWAQSCVVTVKDASSGSFNCLGLQNVNDSNKRIDVSGFWAQP
jgi:hypothetical protein